MDGTAWNEPWGVARPYWPPTRHRSPLDAGIFDPGTAPGRRPFRARRPSPDRPRSASEARPWGRPGRPPGALLDVWTAVQCGPRSSVSIRPRHRAWPRRQRPFWTRWPRCCVVSDTSRL